MSCKVYLGDSVYVEREADTDMLKLTTDNGRGATNTIYLEAEVYDALVAYVAALAPAEKISRGGLTG